MLASRAFVALAAPLCLAAARPEKCEATARKPPRVQDATTGAMSLLQTAHNAQPKAVQIHEAMSSDEQVQDGPVQYVASDPTMDEDYIKDDQPDPNAAKATPAPNIS